MKLKVPEFLTRRPAFLTRKPAKARQPQKLRAATAARRMSPAMDDDYEEEPTTRLSSAFFVVLILHLVAVGGIWAFNGIKAHRRGIEPSPQASTAKAGSESPALSKSQTPPASEPAAPTEARLQPVSAATLNPASQPGANGRTYQVKPNDTLTKIAASQGVTVAELQLANQAKDIAVLRPGQTINVPAKRFVERPVATELAMSNTAGKKTEDAASKALAVRTYAVQKGDTATSIARRFGVTVDDLLKLNKVSDPKKLQLGQALKLPAKK